MNYILSAIKADIWLGGVCVSPPENKFNTLNAVPFSHELPSHRSTPPMSPKTRPGIRKKKGRANISPPGGQLRIPSRINPEAMISRIQPNTRAASFILHSLEAVQRSGIVKDLVLFQNKFNKLVRHHPPITWRTLRTR
jgi:hypothetical protein